MRKNFKYFICVLLTAMFFTSYGRVIHVNPSAIDSNGSGDSWENAVTDLQYALNIANPGDTLWLVMGTYRPGLPGAPVSSSFLIEKEVVLLGGFEGTEDEADERDIEDNTTIFSGDLEGDDIPGNLGVNKSDNVLTVMTITNDATNATIIDGFIFQGGYANLATGQLMNRNGGAIFCHGSPIIRNCIFTLNYAKQSGGAVYLTHASSNGAIITNCRFEKNKADYDYNAGGGLYVGYSQLEGVTVDQCIFMENEGGRGSGICSYQSNLYVTNSVFVDNHNVRQGGGLWHRAGSEGLSLVVDNCLFENNSSSFGGGLYAYIGEDDCTIHLTNTTFSNNSVIPNDMGWWQNGAGVYTYIDVQTYNTGIFVDNCNFNGNTSTGHSGATGWNLLGKGIQLEIRNSSFTNNECGFEGTVVMVGSEGANGNVVVDNCEFENNIARYSGGLEFGNGWNGGAKINYTVSNSFFRNNEAMEAGALGIWSGDNSESTFLIENCEFMGNLGTENGGAVTLWAGNDNFHATFRRSKFLYNSSPQGSAINAYVWLPQDQFPENVSCVLENSLIVGNNSDKAVITMDSIKTLSLINCTLADNNSDGIWLSNQSGLLVQNTILNNNGSNEIEKITNDASIISNGGNLISDNSLNGQNSLDLENQIAEFLGDGENCSSYKLSLGSPGIDQGVSWGDAPLLDLCGKSRIRGTAIDIGAFESAFPESVDERFSKKFDLFPNPASNHLNVEFYDPVFSPVNIAIIDMQGKLVSQQIISGNESVDLEGIDNGIYLIRAIIDNEIFMKKIIKQKS